MRSFRRARRVAVVGACVLLGTSLPASAAAASDAVHDPTVYCSAYSRAATAFVFAGVAQVPEGHDTPPTALTVTCRYISSAGTYTSTTTAPGYVVATAGSGLIGTGAVTVCESAVALYADGHVGSVPERCNTVGMPVDPPDGEVGTEAQTCVHTRQSQTNRWLLVAVAVAPTKTTPVSSMTVDCWLQDANAAAPTASSTTPGPVGVTVGLVSARIADLNGKCVHWRAVYLDNTVEEATACEQL